ncbi:hypothetical protein CCR75_002230 [Bremia lactucae]|uniref:Uncharacterized protein n=1 Tax=Bremia lactucae TaxID=4779 RepID=A0A976IG11_BRELC|nr:hypothetical protein CCR75_002230 [Bremia lactucae]
MANKTKRQTGTVTSEFHQKTAKKRKVTLTKTLTADAKVESVVLKGFKLDEATRKLDATSNSKESITSKAKQKKRKKMHQSSDTFVAEKQQVSKAKSKGDEIEDLFTLLKEKKQRKSIAVAHQKRMEEEEKHSQKKEKERLQQQIQQLEAQNTNSTVAGVNPDPRPVRYDDDGLPIYTEAALQIGKGGNTTDCPFDCWCCF